MNLLPLVFSSGWASGVNAYLVVLVLGLADRLGDLTQVPDELARTDVLVAAGALYALEFVTDKIPYVDSLWDVVSTVVRPLVGAGLAVLVTGQASGDPGSGAATISSWDQALYVLLGGGTALASHTIKAGSRLAVNTSPEPLTTIGVSLGEDVTVLGVMLLALHHPWVALGVCMLLLVVGTVVLVLLTRTVRRGWRRLRRPDRQGRHQGQHQGRHQG